MCTSKSGVCRVKVIFLLGVVYVSPCPGRWGGGEEEASSLGGGV